MKRYYRIFRRGGGTAATISGLIFASALIAGLMIGCKEESSKPTAPSIPVGPDWQTSENSNEMGFYSGKGDGEFGAYAGTDNEFQISVPAGDYVLEYTVQNTSANFAQAVTIDGPYYVVFRASEASVLVIGLFNNSNITSNVSSAVVRYGTLKSFSSSNVWISNSVTLICWPGGGISSWKNAIEINTSRSKIVLIQNGVVASGVKSLPAPSQPVERPAPDPQPAPEPQTPTPTVTVTPAGTPTPTPTTKPVINMPSQPAESIVILDPTLQVGAIIRTLDQQKTYVVAGEKDASGKLTRVTDVTFMANQNDPNSTLRISRDLAKREVTMAADNGDFVKIDQIDTAKNTARVTEGVGGNVTRQTENVPFDDSDINALVDDISGWEQQFKGMMKAMYQVAANLAPWPINWIFQLRADMIDAEIAQDHKCIIAQTAVLGALRDACDAWVKAIFGQGRCGKETQELGKAAGEAFNVCKQPKELSLKLICNGSETSCGDIKMGESATLEAHWTNPKKDGGKITFIAACGALVDRVFNIPTGVLSGVTYLTISHKYSDCSTPWITFNEYPTLDDGSGGGVNSSNLIEYQLIGDNPNALLSCMECINAK